MSAIQLTSAQLAERALAANAGLGGTLGASWSRRVESGEARPYQVSTPSCEFSTRWES